MDCSVETYDLCHQGLRIQLLTAPECRSNVATDLALRPLKKRCATIAECWVIWHVTVLSLTHDAIRETGQLAFRDGASVFKFITRPDKSSQHRESHCFGERF